jgi:hypothetical protein
MTATVEAPPASALAAVAALFASAGLTAQPLPAPLQSCAAITQDSERLACFDRETAAARRAASAAPAPATAGAGASAQPAQNSAGAAVATAKPAAAAADAAPAPTGAAPPLSPEQKLGLSPEGLRKLEAKQGVKPPEVKGLTAHISSVSRGASGRMVFALDNGQTWRQAETRSSFEAAPGDIATISSGALGSFFLATGKHNWIRVERIP